MPINIQEPESTFLNTQVFIKEFSSLLTDTSSKRFKHFKKLIEDNKQNQPEVFNNLKSIDISDILFCKYSWHFFALLYKERFFDPYSLKPQCSALDAFIKQTQSGVKLYYNQEAFEILFEIYDKKLFDPQQEKLYCLRCLSQKQVYPIIKDLFANVSRDDIQNKVNVIISQEIQREQIDKEKEERDLRKIRRIGVRSRW